MGNAHDYSVLASTLTSNGATAMSDNLGVWPAATVAGDTAPIVLGETHLGDTQAGRPRPAWTRPTRMRCCVGDQTR